MMHKSEVEMAKKKSQSLMISPSGYSLPVTGMISALQGAFGSAAQLPQALPNTPVRLFTPVVSSQLLFGSWCHQAPQNP